MHVDATLFAVLNTVVAIVIVVFLTLAQGSAAKKKKIDPELEGLSPQELIARKVVLVLIDCLRIVS